MAQIAQHAHTPTHVHAEEHRTSGWVGWIGFASIMMMLAGIFQAMAGLVGIFQQSFFVVGSNQLIVFNSVHSWGWFHLIMGAIVFLAGISLLSGAVWARMIAVLLAGLSAISYLASIALYPVWSVIGITIAVLVIYAAIVHGGELREEY